MKDDSLSAEWTDKIGPGSPLTNAEWQKAYADLKMLAGMMSRIFNDLARHISADAGLSPDLLGIHPHNALVSRDAGQPWAEVDYNRAQAVKDLLDHEFDANGMVDAFDKAVRLDPHRRWLERQSQLEAQEPSS
jgi:hypothetical protein